MLGAARPGFQRITLGEFEVTALLDGVTVFEQPQGVFGTDQGVADVEAALSAAQLPTAAVETGFTPTVVNTGNELVLFDTGNGAGGRPGRGQLIEQMAAAGYTPDMVDIVVITHMHPDHIGGMMEDGAAAFPNARYVTGQVEYDFFSSDNLVGTPAERIYNLVQANVVPLAENMSFIAPGDQVVSGIEAVNAFGHTPGHMAYHLESGGERLLITADTANHFVLSLQHPDWHVLFDADKEAAAATRRSLFGMAAADGVPFIGYHMPFPSMGYVEAAGDGFRYVPATYQLTL
ncbi:MAG: MBL fold metallo-hydrolase [Pseudomonadota bacterium]